MRLIARYLFVCPRIHNSIIQIPPPRTLQEERIATIAPETPAGTLFGSIGESNADGALYSSSMPASTEATASCARIEAVEGLCPCCGKTKNLSHTFGQPILAVAIAADKDLAAQFSAADVALQINGRGFKVCSSCRSIAGLALKVARSAHPECEPFAMSSSSKTAAFLSKTINCGVRHHTLVTVNSPIMYFNQGHA